VSATAVEAGGSRRREVVTPEGIPLRFVLAEPGERAGAFLLDCVIILLAVIVLFVTMVFAITLAGNLGLAAAVVAFFLVRNFYFPWFELRWQGATPGKRALGLRVVDAGGGPLSGEAVFVRNLMRELETFLPLTALLAPEALWPDAPAWARPVCLVGVLVFPLIPLLNRYRLRVGDMVAGTMVVRAPRALLLADQSATPQPRRFGTPPAEAGFVFTSEQLDVYGIYEVQVLEELLRQRGSAKERSLPAVARKIQEKIAWPEPVSPEQAEAFLRAFYTAQRARLEQRLLLGERRERKRPGRPTRKP